VSFTNGYKNEYHIANLVVKPDRQNARREQDETAAGASWPGHATAPSFLNSWERRPSRRSGSPGELRVPACRLPA